MRRILYASGSGVYGDLREIEPNERRRTADSDLDLWRQQARRRNPDRIACHMFDLVGVAFRFGNVVGLCETHGVGFDFVRRLIADPTELTILGDGSQSKSYVHVSDVIGAVLLGGRGELRGLSPSSTGHGRLHHRHEIAELALDAVGLEPGTTTFMCMAGIEGGEVTSRSCA